MAGCSPVRCATEPVVLWGAVGLVSLIPEALTNRCFQSGVMNRLYSISQTEAVTFVVKAIADQTWPVPGCNPGLLEGPVSTFSAEVVPKRNIVTGGTQSIGSLITLNCVSGWYIVSDRDN